MSHQTILKACCCDLPCKCGVVEFDVHIIPRWYSDDPVRVGVVNFSHTGPWATCAWKGLFYGDEPYVLLKNFAGHRWFLGPLTEASQPAAGSIPYWHTYPNGTQWIKNTASHEVAGFWYADSDGDELHECPPLTGWEPHYGTGTVHDPDDNEVPNIIFGARELWLTGSFPGFEFPAPAVSYPLPADMCATCRDDTSYSAIAARFLVGVTYIILPGIRVSESPCRYEFEDATYEGELYFEATGHRLRLTCRKKSDSSILFDGYSVCTVHHAQPLRVLYTKLAGTATQADAYWWQW